CPWSGGLLLGGGPGRPDDDAGVALSTVPAEPEALAVVDLALDVAVQPHDLELVGVVVAEEGHRDAHLAVVVAWDLADARHLDGGVVVVGREALRVVGVAGVERDAPVAMDGVEVRVPAEGAVLLEPLAAGGLPVAPAARRSVLGDREDDGPAARVRHHPGVAGEDHRPHVPVRRGALGAERDEALAVLDRLREVLGEQARRRRGRHDVRLAEQVDDFVRAEVPVAGERPRRHGVRPVGETELADSPLAAGLVADPDHALDPEEVEVVAEVGPEPAEGVVAVEQDRLAAEVVAERVEAALHVGELDVVAVEPLGASAAQAVASRGLDVLPRLKAGDSYAAGHATRSVRRVPASTGTALASRSRKAPSG